MGLPGAARAQLVDQLFGNGVPGFEQQGGLPVLSRPRPEYGLPPLDVHGYSVRAGLNQSLTHDSNVDGLPKGRGSFLIDTAPSIDVSRVGTRNQIGLSASLDDERFFETPGQDRTNWTVALGGRSAIGLGKASLGYAHFDSHEVTTQLGAIPSSTAIPVKQDDVRGGYGVDVGRFTVTPTIEDARFRYGAGSALGVRLDESFLDRNVLTGGVTVHYGDDPSRGALVALQGIETDYQRTLPGVPSSSARSVLAVGGVDYQSDGLFRYLLLAGVEHRTFVASQLAPVTTPVVEASVIWIPTGLTTVTTTVSRRIEDSVSGAAGSFTYSHARVVVDHELRRNVLLQARTDFQVAEYSLGGTQTSVGIGGGVTWLLGPRLRITADYNFVHQGALTGGAALGFAGTTATVGNQYRPKPCHAHAAPQSVAATSAAGRSRTTICRVARFTVPRCSRSTPSAAGPRRSWPGCSTGCRGGSPAARSRRRWTCRPCAGSWRRSISRRPARSAT